MKNVISITRLLLTAIAAVALLLPATARAAAPGITGGTGLTATFNLIAQTAYITQPDGAMVYSCLIRRSLAARCSRILFIRRGSVATS